MCIIICFGLICFVVINATIASMREHHVRDVVENRFQYIINAIEDNTQKAVGETSMFVRLPAVIRAYEIAHRGNMDDVNSPRSQEARELLRKELAPMLDSYSDATGRRLQLHFHLPSGLSLVRLWREKNTRIGEKWVDISDDLRSYRHTILDVNRTGEPVTGIESGSEGLAIRGVIPVISPDGRQLGSAEVLQDFDHILDAATVEGKIYIALYSNKDVLDFSVTLQDQEDHPIKGDFVRVTTVKNPHIESLITPELLTKGKTDRVFEYHDSVVLATLPIDDYMGRQIGVMVCAMNNEAVSGLAGTAKITLAFMLVGMVIVPSIALLIRSRILVTNPLNKIKAKIQDIAESRADLIEQVPISQNDEIGELVKWFNKLTAKMSVMLNGLRKADDRMQSVLEKLGQESSRFESMAHWYESILDAIPHPISVQDMDTRWTFINATLEKLIGKKRKEVISLPCSNLGASICKTDDCAIECMKRGEKQTRFVNNGASYQVDVATLTGLYGEATGVIEVIQDVTQLELMVKQRAEAEAASSAKSDFLAKMSHEIRTPLNAILGLAEIQLQKPLPPETRMDMERIRRFGATLLGIINNILDISKIEAGGFELIQAEYDVSKLIDDVVQLNIVRIGSKNIALELRVDKTIPARLYGDELRVKQILNNLLSNAIKYTKEGKISFSVEWRRDGESAELAFDVNDTGVGIKEDDLKKLFSEYTQLNLRFDPSIEGTGLGLAITKNLAEMMGGTITVQSTYGEGSSFRIVIRQKILDETSIGKQVAHDLEAFRYDTVTHNTVGIVARTDLSHGKVLVVDDVPINLEVAKGLMEPYGLAIDTVGGGQEAIRKIKEEKVLYDAVFMDHMMPDTDGLEATRIIRNEIGTEYARTVPIIALTANALTENREKFLANGFDDFLAKPIDIAQLDAKLNRWIGRKKKSSG